MAKVIRYALAAICLAASVGCLALWWRSQTKYDRFTLLSGGIVSESPIKLETVAGIGVVGIVEYEEPFILPIFESSESECFRFLNGIIQESASTQGLFGRMEIAVYFPLWFPAPVFALAAVAAIRVGRRFTLRSTIIATTIVALLLGDGCGVVSLHAPSLCDLASIGIRASDSHPRHYNVAVHISPPIGV